MPTVDVTITETRRWAPGGGGRVSAPPAAIRMTAMTETSEVEHA